ncbi:MAG TPA: ClpXP protease specificity-enhancing factor SspB [Bradyrhizobium sp.]|nr:ClpXP protease specificity-enhancing factor SspB [Bradyrhizobium sp.]
MGTTGRGVPDIPQARGMIIPYAAGLVLLAILLTASPAFAEPCSRPAARSKIAETLPLASEQRPVNVTFRTHADGVKLSISLKSKYPDDMTIILQHDFEQLSIKEDRFEVLLRLMGNRERLTVPFNAIKAFWDKSDLKCSDG